MSESFLLYTSDYQLIEGLTDAQIGQLARALFIYARDGEQIKLEPVVRMAFVFIKDKIDRNMDKYQKKCERLRANAKKRWEEKQKQAIVCKDMQLHTKANNCMQINSDSVSDSVSEDKVTNVTMNPNSNNILSKESYSSPKTDVLNLEPEETDSSRKKCKVDAKAIKDYWNERHDKTNSSMRRLTLMSENRKVMIRARLRQVGGDAQMLYRAIDMAMASDFMNGNNSRGWTANFDWIFGNENNFAKTLEGYDDKPARKPQQSGSQQPTLGERYQEEARTTEDRGKRKDDALRDRILQMISLIAENPKSLCRGQLEEYRRNGTMQRLGIEWNG